MNETIIFAVDDNIPFIDDVLIEHNGAFYKMRDRNRLKLLNETLLSSISQFDFGSGTITINTLFIPNEQ